MQFYLKDYVNHNDIKFFIEEDDNTICSMIKDHRTRLISHQKYLKGELKPDMFCTQEDIEDCRKIRIKLVAGLIARSMFSHITDPEEILQEVNYVINVILNDYPDFFTAPASTTYHGDWEGGLMDHSLAVFEAACGMANTHLDTEVDKVERLYPIWFLLHDLCKCNCYERTTKNRKNVETGKWETVECWGTRKDYISSFHGSESVNRIYELLLKDPTDYLDWLSMSFTEAWRLAISYHMGMYGISDADMINYSNAKRNHPEVLLMHHADMVASQIWKV